MKETPLPKKKKTYEYEIMLIFILLDLINYFFFRSDMGFLKATLHPYWLAIIFIPARYGLQAGFLTGILAAAHLLFFSLGHFPSRLDIEKLSEIQGLHLPIAFVIIALFLGVLRQTYKDSEAQKDKELQHSNKVINELRKTIETSEKARRLLEGRIVGETTTVRTLYEAAKRFDNLDLQVIYQGCLTILAEHLKVQKSSLYVKEGDYLILKTTFGWPEGQAASGKVLYTQSIMQLVFENKEILTVKDILKNKQAKKYEAQFGSVLAMIPLYDQNNDVQGVVNIEQMDFLNFNKSNLDLIRIIVDWASRAITNKLRLEKIKSQLIFDEEEGIYSNNYFKTALDNEILKASDFNHQLAIAFIKMESFGFLEERSKSLISRRLSSHLKQVFSSSDMIFHYKFEGTYVVICPFRNQNSLNKSLNDFKDRYALGLEDLKLPSLVIASGVWSNQQEDSLVWINSILKECHMPPY